MRGRDKLKKYSIIIKLLIFIFSLFPKEFLHFFFKKVDNFRGNFGILIRYILLKNIALDCGENVSIHRGCYIFNIDKISFGENVSIHPMCYIDGLGGIFIGNDTSIAHGVTIMSSTHTFSDKKILIKDQLVSKHFTSIGDNVWIGAKSVIIGGVNISNRVIIGASSTVTKDIESNVIVAGIPARIIKNF